jgi:hypothetical protein
MRTGLEDASNGPPDLLSAGSFRASVLRMRFLLALSFISLCVTATALLALGASV